MRIFVNKPFQRFARQENIADSQLVEAISRAGRGQIDADLGGNVIKQRVPRPGEGRSGGFRTIILYLAGERAFFVYGYPKNAKGNIRTDELTAFRLLAKTMLAYSDADLQLAVDRAILREVRTDEKEP
jgi:hypothetical protein